MSRSRRHVLRFGVLSTVAALAGCQSSPSPSDTTSTSATPASPTSTSTRTPTATPTPPTPSDPIEVVCSNDTDTTVELQVEISGFDGFLTERSVRVPAGETASLDSGITETGRYLLTVRSDSGHEESWEVSVDEYSLRTGANLLVVVDADGLELLVEE